MRTLKILLLLLLGMASANAQYGVEADPITGKQGMIDPTEGYVKIPFEYDEIQPHLGAQLAILTKGDLRGVWTENHSVAVPLQFEQIDLHLEAGVQQGIVRVGKGGRWGLYKLGEKLVLPVEYEYVNAIPNGLLVARSPGDTLLQFFDGQGIPLFKAPGQTAGGGFDEHTAEISRSDRSRYFLDRKGQDPFGGRFENGRWTDGKTVIGALLDHRGKPGLKGLFTWEGDTLLPPVYYQILVLPGGNFLVKSTDEKMGMVDESGRFLIPLGEATLSKMGNQPQDVILAQEESSLSSKVYDTKGRLLLDRCATGNVAFKGRGGNVANQHFHRYFTARTKESQTTGLFHLDGRPILPMQYTDILYASDQHPLIVYDGVALAILGWDGKPAYPGRFKRLEHALDPSVLYGVPENGQLGGFVHIGHPERDRFVFQKMVLFPRSGYFSVKQDGAYYLHDAAGRRLNDQGYAFLEQPERKHYTAWREQGKPGRLVAYEASAPGGDDQPWVGLDEKGKAFPMAAVKPPESPVMQDEMMKKAPRGQ